MQHQQRPRRTPAQVTQVPVTGGRERGLDAQRDDGIGHPQAPRATSRRPQHVAEEAHVAVADG